MTKPSQTELSRNALTAKRRRNAAPTHPSAEPPSDAGVNDVSRPDYPPSGAFDAEGHRPVLERSRKER